MPSHDKARPLRLDEILRIGPVRDAAFRDNPVITYMHDTPDANKSRTVERVRTAINALQVVTFIQCKGAWTIGDCSGYILYRPALNSYGPLQRALQHVLLKISDVVSSFGMRICYSKEQRRRMTETNSKHEAVTLKLWGKEVDDMIAIDMLAVAPGKQGLGYGSALVEVAVDEADKQSRRAWLYTRPATADRFYQRYGFVVVGKYTMGENDPAWKEPPIEGVMMMREPQSSFVAKDSMHVR